MTEKFKGRGSYMKNLSPEERKRLSSIGGQAAVMELGKEHFSEIGEKGGKKVASTPGHMAKIGRLGGIAKRGKR